jgi:hexosaminidase
VTEAQLFLLPKPASLIRRDGVFAISRATLIAAPQDAVPEACLLADMAAAVIGFPLQVGSEDEDLSGTIELRLDETVDFLGVEGYRLSVTLEGIAIVSAGKAGLFYGAQTLVQLLSYGPAAMGSVDVPCVEIEDSPRFSWRGAMLDVARHYFPVSFLYKFVDLLAMHKANVLHLHLTDDQGWRLEIKKYPKLTEVGARRRATVVGRPLKSPAHDGFSAASDRYDNVPHGGFYTQETMRELVAYAAARHITIVPEIEMPGHAQAAVAAYPELGCVDTRLNVSGCWGIHDVLFNASDKTLALLEDVLTEVMEIFPSPYIHIGGDEAMKRQWRESAACQARIAELGLRDEAELQSYVVRRMDGFLARHGRRLVGWDEILEGGLAPGAVVMSWRGNDGGLAAARMGHDVVMAPHRYTYLDYYQTEDHAREPLAALCTITLRKAYSFEPIPSELPGDLTHHVLGTQCQLWTEYMPNTVQVEYMAFPRLCALAEVMWSKPAGRDFDEFAKRLSPHLRRLDAMSVHYRPRDEASPEADCGTKVAAIA